MEPIILADSQGGVGAGDEVQLPHSLLCKVETESWKNGGQSGQQEGRTTLPEPPFPIQNSTLISSTPTHLHFDLNKCQVRKIPAEVEMDEPELDPKQRADSMKDADDDCPPPVVSSHVDAEFETLYCVYPKREYSPLLGLETTNDEDASTAPKIRKDIELRLPPGLEKFEEETEQDPCAE